MAFIEGAAVARDALKLLAPFAGTIALVAGGFAAGVTYEHKAPWALGPHLKRVESSIDGPGGFKAREEQWKASAAGWEASFRKSEGFRQQEHAQAVRAISDGAATCQARVDGARQSAAEIRAIITKEPSHDAQGCPVRQLVDPDSLWNAIRRSAPGGG